MKDGNKPQETLKDTGKLRVDGVRWVGVARWVMGIKVHFL